MKILHGIVDHFRASESDVAEIYGQDKAFSFRNFAWILLAWMILWTVWPPQFPVSADRISERGF